MFFHGALTLLTIAASMFRRLFVVPALAMFGWWVYEKQIYTSGFIETDGTIQITLLHVLLLSICLAGIQHWIFGVQILIGMAVIFWAMGFTPENPTLEHAWWFKAVKNALYDVGLLCILLPCLPAARRQIATWIAGAEAFSFRWRS